MPVTPDDVGRVTKSVEQSIDDRWLMAYAASLGETLPEYFDTTRKGGIVGHPAFPVALEWEPILRQVDEDWFPGPLTLKERSMGVHAMHDLHLHRPVCSGEAYSTRMTHIGAYARNPGAFQVSKLETLDGAGTPLFTTYMRNLLRGVELIGDDKFIEVPPPPPDFAQGVADSRRFTIDVPASQAHIYTECARIWAPIHTDRSVALAAGLPDIILHGTCTLALAVSAVMRALKLPPAQVSRLGCRFSEIVRMPSTLTLAMDRRTPSAVSFELLTESGAAALSQAFLCWRN